MKTILFQQRKLIGDNDQLSGNVAKLISSELLVILTDQDGVFDKILP